MTRVKFVISHWSVSIHLLLSRSVRSLFVGFVCVVDKSFVRRRYSWEVSVPAFKSQSLKTVRTVG